MKAALISLGSTSSKWTAEAMRKYFEEVDEIDIRKIEIKISSKENQILYNGEALKEYDCIYGKGSFRYSALLSAITSAYFKKCYMPFSQDAFTKVHDKLLTHLELQKNQIPMPNTYLSSTTAAAKDILKKVNYPIIMKFPQGTQGKGVMVADSFAGASSVLDALQSLRQPFIIQEYIETNGKDIRAMVIGGKVVAAMERKSKEDEKRSNIHAGGSGEAVNLDSHTQKIAIQTAKILDSDICAVDILNSHKGPLVIEANLSPGLQGITKATKVSVADKIAKYLYQRTKEFVEKNKSTDTTKILDDLGIKGTEEETKQLITTIDIRGDRLLIPGVVSKLTKFNDKEDVIFEITEGKLIIKKFN